MIRNAFVLFLAASSAWMGCGNNPLKPGAAGTGGSSVGTAGAGGTISGGGTGGGTGPAGGVGRGGSGGMMGEGGGTGGKGAEGTADGGGKGAEATADGGDKGTTAPPMPCATSGACTSICSGACVFNAAKMRTECTVADTRCAGMCGQGCDLQCGGASACNVTVVAGGAFDCKGATCNITVGAPDATVECSGAGTMCNITCQGDCTYECAKGATCRVQCGSGAPVTTMISGGCGTGAGPVDAGQGRADAGP
jgi:hypothetical protein